MRSSGFGALALAGLLCGAAHADIAVRDDAGQTIRLARPAQRIVSIAPHATENLFAIGAGERLVGVPEFSDYPQAAQNIRRIGSYERLDLEAILALKPDLVVGWQSGNPPAAIARLKALGLPVYLDQPERLADIAASLERLGRLTGREAQADAQAARLREGFAALTARYAGRRPVRVFYQIWQQPLMTIGGPQIISDILRLCGARNVFGHLTALAPTISEEAVVAADPEAIIAATDLKSEAAIAHWKRWPQLQAVAKGRLYTAAPDVLHRPTPRLLEGARALCADIDRARGK